VSAQTLKNCIFSARKEGQVGHRSDRIERSSDDHRTLTPTQNKNKTQMRPSTSYDASQQNKQKKSTHKPTPTAPLYRSRLDIEAFLEIVK
jgi:hypothetical protein